MVDFTYYELLRLDPSASTEEVRAAYLRVSKQVHPDAGGSEALFRQVNLAYEVLSDPVRRAAYDRSGCVDEQASGAEGAASGWSRAGARSGRQDGSAGGSPPGSTGAQDPGSASGPPPRAGPPPGRGQGEKETRGPGGRDQGSTSWRRISGNPSTALLIAGVVLLAVATDFGGAAPDLINLGLVAALVGVVGVLGRHRLARALSRRLGIEDIDTLTDAQLEWQLSTAFELAGFAVYHGERGVGSGVHLVLDGSGSRIVVRATTSHSTKATDMVGAVVASRERYGADRAILGFTGRPTMATGDLAQSSDVEIWDRRRIVSFLATQDMNPPRTGGRLLGDEVRAGAPTVLRAFLVISLSAAVTMLSGRGGRRRRRR